MKRTIQVYLGNAERGVGTLHHDAVSARERSAFTYYDAWLNAPDRFPIEPGLPTGLRPAVPRAGYGLRVPCGYRRHGTRWLGQAGDPA